MVSAAANPDLPETLDAVGESARREHERRKANDEARTRAKWGKLGGLAVALSDEKQSTKAGAVELPARRPWGLGLTGWRRRVSGSCMIAAFRARRPTLTTSW